MEEIINMYSEKVKRIYNNDSVKEISKRLKNLLQHKEGYEILTALYGVANEAKMSKILSHIIDEYDRGKSKKDPKKKYYYGNVSNENLEELISLLNDKEDAKIMANAIIGYSKVFFKSNNDKNIDNNEEIIESEEV
jgi:endonuclease YncB( thermonuclease family)